MKPSNTSSFSRALISLTGCAEKEQPIELPVIERLIEHYRDAVASAELFAQDCNKCAAALNEIMVLATNNASPVTLNIYYIARRTLEEIGETDPPLFQIAK